MSNDFDDRSVIEELRRVLKTKGISLRQLSSDLQVPYRTVQNYMGGESRVPLSFFLRACQYIGVGADYFVNRDFRPHAQDMYDAVFDVLNEAGKLPPIDETQHDSSVVTFFTRNSFAGMMTAKIIEKYDQHRRAWLSRRDQGRGYSSGDRYRLNVPTMFDPRAGEVGE